MEVLRSSSTISEPEAVGQALQAASLVTTPPLAENSKQFEAARKGLEDAAVASGGLWVSYLFVAFYLAIAAGAVTHLDLFLENPVRLPFLNIELPLLAFFSLAPILFLIIHVYALAHFVILSERANNYNAALRALLGVAQDHASEALAAGDAMRRQLPSNVIVQFLAGPQYSRNGAFGLLLGAIAWITLVVAPIGLFLLLQVQFLPFHDALITWVQRGALAFDVLLSIWLWRKILSARERASPQRSWVSRLATAFAIVAIIAAIAIAVLSCTLVTFPGEWQETALPSLEIFPALHGDSTDGGEVERVSLHEWLFNSPVDKFTRRRKLPLSSTLVLTAANVYEGMKVDDPKKTEWRKFVFSARGRNLNGAVFELASLPKVDFAGAQLQGVSFNEAQLQGSSFDAAQLQDSSFRFASLEGTSFESADLEYADFSFAVLPGASLILAQLQGADLEYASLQGELDPIGGTTGGWI
ncbi:MAG: pentapeptide repeat-containing protein [Roseiarcus sp.]